MFFFQNEADFGTYIRNRNQNYLFFLLNFGKIFLSRFYFNSKEIELDNAKFDTRGFMKLYGPAQRQSARLDKRAG